MMKIIEALGFQRKLLLNISIIWTFLLVNISTAALSYDISLRGFGSDHFFETETNQPGGFRRENDPIDPSNNSKVFSFSLTPQPCITSDCEQQSARSAIQQYNATQPKEAWYGSEIYFPKDFPYGRSQIQSFNIFNEWKDQDECLLLGLTNFGGTNDPDLSWTMQRRSKENNCKSVYSHRIARMKDIVGSWHRLEIFIRWSKESDGVIELYLDEQLKMEYKGTTCFEGCEANTYVLFGHYMCCTPNAEKIKPSTVFYRNISRSTKRDGLKWGRN